jgi:molybdenum cofactor synthesis domain-containing protein
MRPFAETLPFDVAYRFVLDAGRPTSRIERIPVETADGRVLADGVTANQDVPAFDRAAMDGFAVLAADTAAATAESPVPLRQVARVFTGEICDTTVVSGSCIEVATGAPLPPGADAVVMVEHTRRDDGVVHVQRPASPRQHVGARGGDIRQGESLLEAGVVFTPARIGAITAIGLTHVEVYAKPRVAIMCTGDEVVSPGLPLRPGQVYNVNRYTLEALVRRHGGEPVIVPTTRDSLVALDASLAIARTCDLIVTSGGSSVGEHDLVIDMLRAHGEVLFHGIAIKPGKPTVFGRIGDTLLLGLSGYPTSCLSNAHVLLVPLLRLTARLPEWNPRTITVPLARRIRSAAGRLQFYTVRVEGGQAVPAFKASGDITSMAYADGYVTIPAEVEALDANTLVTVTYFG